ncbi:MAG: ferrous iron transporter B [Candidatus Omnitrophica bacterium]|nr:ferrous iron transporter B [Candidatus Omnitrophota bacterium]
MKAVLVGNPNVGKSAIFNALTGRYVTVSNYPGTTVEVARGEIKLGNRRFQLVDTPGINTLIIHSEDERVTKEILSASDIFCVIQVIDSKNLRRSLLLTLELIQLKLPLVLALNMIDEARERGIRINTQKLAEKLGVEAVETIAITGQGIPQLKEAILKAKPPSLNLDFSAENSLLLFKKRINFIEELLKDVLELREVAYKNMAQKISRFTTQPLLGTIILAGVVWFMYQFVGVFSAGKIVDFLEETVFGKYLGPLIINFVHNYIPFGIIQELLVGEYGLFTMGLTYAFAIVLPIVGAFFIFFGILEDSGYLPRLSVLSDRLFKFVGLNGRAILPLVLGLGCGTMATLTSRILETKKEKILTILLLSLCIPCSAQLGVILGMLGGLSAKALFIWLGVIILVMLLVGFFASRVIPGERPAFIQEIPPLRIPQWDNILNKTFARLKWYLREAVPLFILGTLLLFLLDKIGWLKKIEYLLNPLVVKILNLPSKSTEAFILGFLRRDYGIAGLYMLRERGLLDNRGVLVSSVVITLFVPCLAQFLITIKERGLKTAILIASFVFIFSFFVGGLLNFILQYFNISL